MKQLSIDDLLMEKQQAYIAPEKACDKVQEPKKTGKICDMIQLQKNMILEVGRWVRLINGNVYQIKAIGKPSQVFCGMEKKPKKDGTFYYKRVFKEEKSIVVNYHNPETGKKINEIVYETDILMSSFFMMDCITKADRVFTQFGGADVMHKYKSKKEFLISCFCNGQLMVFKECDIVGFDNVVKRGNVMRNLSINDEVKDRFHGWGVIVNITPHKVFVKSPNFNRVYVLAELQIIDYKNKYDD